MADEPLEREEFVVTREEEGQRLDRVLAARISDVSRSRVRAWLDQGRVEVSGTTVVKPSLGLREGWKIALTRPAPVATKLLPMPVPLHVVHEDEELLVLDKPAGLTVHPGAGRREEGTLVHGLLHLHPDRAWPGPPERPGIIHRLDRLTSGLLVVACTPRAYLVLQRQIAAHAAQRGYIALVWGSPARSLGIIDAPIGRDPRERTRMAVVRRGGRPARTRYRLLRAFGPLSLLDVRLETGRTHQIRVHLAHAGFPVFGDAIYGGGKAALTKVDPSARPVWVERLRRLNRQALHAYHLELEHPRDGRRWIFESPLPEEIEGLLLDLIDEDGMKGAS